MAWIKLTNVDLTNGSATVLVNDLIDLDNLRSGWILLLPSNESLEIESGTLYNATNGYATIVLETPYAGPTLTAQSVQIVPLNAVVEELFQKFDQSIIDLDALGSKMPSLGAGTEDWPVLVREDGLALQTVSPAAFFDRVGLQTHLDSATASATASAEAARDLAEKWASNPEDVEVQNGYFSSMHYMLKTQQLLTTALKWKGTFDATVGPSEPSPQVGDFYRVAVAGTFDGKDWQIDDSAYYNGTSYDKIDNTDKVSSVAGKIGAVTLVSTDITDFTSAVQSVGDPRYVNVTGDTLTGTLTVNTDASDTQLRLETSGVWAGIHFKDVDGFDNIFFKGSTGTFAIGGGGSIVAGKKLHIDGATSIGSAADSKVPPSEGLYVTGSLQTAAAGSGSIDRTKGLLFESLAGITPWNPNPAGSGSYRSIAFHTTGWTGAAVETREVLYLTGGSNNPWSVGIGTPTPGVKLDVIGEVRSDTGFLVGSFPVWHQGNDGAGSTLDADLLDGQHGSYYLDWTNVTNKPDPVLTINGDASGAATFTDLGNATLTLTIADDSHNHIISNVDGLQAALDGKLGVSAKAADSELLDGVDSSQFLRSDVDDTVAANYNVVAGKYHRFGHANELDTNDGKIGARLFAPGLNIVGTKTEVGGDREIRLWGNVVTSGGEFFYHDGYHPTADRWTTARTLSLTGDASGSTTWDGSGNASINVTINDDSHFHVISNVDGLQAALDSKSINGHTHDDRYYTESEADGRFHRHLGNVVNEDWNTFVDGTENGYRSVLNAGGANRPGAYMYGTLVSWATAGQGKFQLYAPHNGSDGQDSLWYRSGWNTDYDNWTRIITLADRGSGKGFDADLLDGAHGNTAHNDFTGNEYVRRSGSGYIFSNYFNMTADNFTGTPNRIAIDAYGDNYLRWQTWGTFRNQLEVGFNADTVDGLHASSFALTSGTYSGLRAQATTKADVGLGSVDNYSRAHYDGRYLGINAKAADSNLLDGLDSSAFATAGHNHDAAYVKRVQNVADITQRINSGFYEHDTASTAEGWPENDGWYHAIVSTHSNQANYYSMQIAGDFYNANDVFYRITNGIGTAAWHRLWHSGNDGAGSGLDAGLLGGQARSAAADPNTVVSRDSAGKISALKVTGQGADWALLTTGTFNGVNCDIDLTSATLKMPDGLSPRKYKIVLTNVKSPVNGDDFHFRVRSAAVGYNTNGNGTNHNTTEHGMTASGPFHDAYPNTWAIVLSGNLNTVSFPEHRGIWEITLENPFDLGGSKQGYFRGSALNSGTHLYNVDGAWLWNGDNDGPLTAVRFSLFSGSTLTADFAIYGAS